MHPDNSSKTDNDNIVENSKKKIHQQKEEEKIIIPNRQFETTNSTQP